MDFNRLRKLDSLLHSNEYSEPKAWQSRLGLIGAVTCGIFMLAIALRMSGPTINPDEWGFLTNGQVLIGHNEAPFPSAGSFYPAGYGFVTGLGALLTGSISGSYRFSLVVNFLLAIVTAWYAGRLARRGFGASQNMSRLISALVFVVPGTIVSAMFAWAETIARLLFLIFIGLVLRASKEKSWQLVVGLGIFTGLLPAIHGRFMLLLPIVCLLFAWWWLRKEVTFMTSAAAVLVTMTGYAFSYLLNTFVKTTIYEKSFDQQSRLLRRLVNPEVWPALIRTMVGQSWYLIGSSCGFLLVALFFTISRLRSDGGTRSIGNDPERVTLLVMLLGTFAIVFTGGLQLLYGDRGDHLMYGRYVEMVVPTLLMVSCVGLERTVKLARRAWLIGGLSIICIAYLYVLIDAGDGVKERASQGNIVYPNIVGFDIAHYLVSPGLISFGLLFMVFALFLWAIARKNSAFAVVVLVVAFSLGSMYSGQNSVLTRTNRLDETTKTVQIVKDSGTKRVGFDIDLRNDRSYYYMRYKLHPIQVVRFDISGPEARIPMNISCAYGRPDKPPADGDWVIVATEDAVERVLWQRVGSSHC